MASSFFLLLLLISMAPILASSYQFKVGGERGWAEPAGNDSEAYNDWAAKNRFHVGDSVSKFQSFTNITIYSTINNRFITGVCQNILKLNLKTSKS